jgi:hypothetical protein
MKIDFTRSPIYKQGKADGIAQGRREAAEEFCKTCHRVRDCSGGNACERYKAILGTASAEKADDD